jgi:proline iminopeptidase
VLGHSFGGQVALEYALRYPDRLSHLVLLDTGGDSRWSQQNAADLLARPGYGTKKVELVRRWFNGEFTPRENCPIFLRGDAYCSGPSWPLLIRQAIHGGWRSKTRPQPLIFAGRHLLKGWTVMDRLDQITVPTLVMAGRDDFVFPSECQRELAAGIPQARLQLIDHAGHDPHDEQTAEVMKAVREFHLHGRAGGLTRPPAAEISGRLRAPPAPRSRSTARHRRPGRQHPVGIPPRRTPGHRPPRPRHAAPDLPREIF